MKWMNSDQDKHMMQLVEIDIGKPLHKEGWNDNNGWQCSAVALSPYGAILSHNDVSYWFSLDEYNLGGRISKNCPEGQKLSKIIADEIPIAYLRKYILHWCLGRMDPKQFVGILDWVRDEAFKEGKNAVRRTLAHVLTEE